MVELVVEIFILIIPLLIVHYVTTTKMEFYTIKDEIKTKYDQ